MEWFIKIMKQIGFLILFFGTPYLLLRLVRGIIKFVIKEFKKMSDEVDVEIKKSKEKKGE